MVQVVIRFFTLNVVSENPIIYWGIGFVWILLLIASVSSLRSSNLSSRAVISWFLIILAFPLLGLACYCIRCLTCNDWSFFELILVRPAAVKSVQSK